MSKPASGLDINVPERGAARDAFEVAATATMLHARRTLVNNQGTTLTAARHAVTLHRISGRLHRIAERLCCEDLSCPVCRGDGQYSIAGEEPKRRPCGTCAGHGNTLGRQLERLRQQCRDIATEYGLVPYFQTDPRGCSLYLIDPATVPAVTRLASYIYQTDQPHMMDPDDTRTRDTLRARWIKASYNRGHAIVRLGR